MAAELSTSDPNRQQEGIAGALASISERASLLISEEIALAKAELQIKAKTLGRGAGIAVAAGVFAIFGIVFLFEALSWGIWQAFIGGNSYWAGFLIVAVLLFAFGGLSGYLAHRWLKSSTSPAPTMAMDEARLIKETVVKASEGGTVPPTQPPTGSSGTVPPR